MTNQNKYILIFTLFLGLSYAQKGLSHGVSINYQETKAINIKATYDSGDPIKNGQVTVYNPNDTANPWLTGNTNEEGEFMFTPDYYITGNWQVKVLQAGHGHIISIPINQESSSNHNSEQKVKVESGTIETKNNVKSENVNNADYTIQQKLIMAGFGIWGCVGTAFYFSKKEAEQ